jgi:hypothetical protein
VVLLRSRRRAVCSGFGERPGTGATAKEFLNKVVCRSDAPAPNPASWVHCVGSNAGSFLPRPWILRTTFLLRWCLMSR